MYEFADVKREAWSVNETVMGLINMYGYFGIFFLIFIENVFPPIPSEVILLFGGSLAVASGLGAPGVIAAATLGSLLGALLLYYIGYRFNAETLKKVFSGRAGRITRIKPEYVEMSEKWFVRYRNKAVLLCRCVPLVRSFISLPAGFSKMRLSVFVVLTLIGSAVWNTVLVLIGVALGETWTRALPYFERYAHIAVIVIAAAAAVFILYRIMRRKKDR